MGAEVVLETEAGNDQDGREDLLVLMPDAIEVRRNAGTAGLLGVAGAAIAIAYFARATQTGAVLDWVLALIMGLLGAYWLRSLVDARTPLLVADDQGLRLRLGRRWHGLPWSAVNRLEYTPRQGLLREGRISVAPHNDEVLVSELDPLARAQTALAQRLHGARYTVPLGLTTRVVGADADLATALAEVVQGRCGIEEPHRGQEPVSTDLDSHPEDHSDLAPEPDAEPVASATPVPLRAASSGRRSEIRRDTAEQGMDDSDRPQGRELHRPGSVNLVEETQAWGDRISPIARAGDPVEPLVIDEFEVEPEPEHAINLAAGTTTTTRSNLRSTRSSGQNSRPPVPAWASPSTNLPYGPGSVPMSSNRSRSMTSSPVVATSMPAVTCGPWPEPWGSTVQACWRPTTSVTRTPRSTRAVCSRQSWRPE